MHAPVIRDDSSLDSDSSFSSEEETKNYNQTLF